MAKLKVSVPYMIKDGSEVLFHAPCDFTSIDGLEISYVEGEGIATKSFSLVDAEGNDLSELPLFKEGALVKVLLDLKHYPYRAFIQNGVTNGYLESKIDGLVPKVYEYTLWSDSWDRGSAEYSLDSDGFPADTYDLEISLRGDNLTEEQKLAYENAEIIGYGNDNVIKAFGIIPEIDIPVLLKVVDKRWLL